MKRYLPMSPMVSFSALGRAVWTTQALMLALCTMWAGTALGQGGVAEEKPRIAKALAEQIQVDAPLSDGTFVGIIAGDRVMSVELAKEWARAVGNALHYSAATGKKPWAVLIAGAGDAALTARCRGACERAGIGLALWDPTARTLKRVLQPNDEGLTSELARLRAAIEEVNKRLDSLKVVSQQPGGKKPQEAHRH